jgi:hypothetical protein
MFNRLLEKNLLQGLTLSFGCPMRLSSSDNLNCIKLPSFQKYNRKLRWGCWTFSTQTYMDKGVGFVLHIRKTRVTNREKGYWYPVATVKSTKAGTQSRCSHSTKGSCPSSNLPSLTEQAVTLACWSAKKCHHHELEIDSSKSTSLLW